MNRTIETLLILLLTTLIAGCITSGSNTSTQEQPIQTTFPQSTEVNGTIQRNTNETGLNKSAPSIDQTTLREGTWNISYGNLSSFSHLHFIGEGEFKVDGSYRLTTHPREFDPIEGVIEYTGRYASTGLEVNGSGRSAIRQRGQVFGNPATDILKASLDSSGTRMEGKIVSVSGFHSGSGEGEAIFEFVLKREALPTGSLTPLATTPPLTITPPTISETTTTTITTTTTTLASEPKPILEILERKELQGPSGEFWIEGKIKNNGGVEAVYVQASLVLIDMEENVIRSMNSAPIEKINPGATSNFRIRSDILKSNVLRYNLTVQAGK